MNPQIRIPPEGVFCASAKTPWGRIYIADDGACLHWFNWRAPDPMPTLRTGGGAKSPLTLRALEWLEGYIAGKWRDPADLPRRVQGSDFQKKVWRQLVRIPHAHSCTYRDIARTIGSAPRAVGGACKANRFSLIIPCHRVVGKNRKSGGYRGSAAGIDTKHALLNHEKSQSI